MRFKGLVLTGILCLLFSTHIFSQVQTARNIAMIPNSGGFYEYLPEGYNSGNQSYPLLLFIHGLGEVGNGTTQLPIMLNNAIPRMIDQGTFPTSFLVNGQTFRFIVISPQFIGWPVPADIDGILNYLVQHYRIDQTRVYMTGLSMGGGVTWDYAGGSSAYANRLAAIVPIAGASYPEISRGRNIAGANLPVWATHNTGDSTVPVSYTNDYITNINMAPSPNPLAKKSIFPVIGHDAWTKTYDPAWKEDGVLNVYQWMLQYNRPNAGSNPNQLPVVNAGVNQNIFLPTTTATLTGTATDSSGTIISYAWTQISGTPATITNPSSPATSITGLTTTGTRTFALTVTDNHGATGNSYVSIIVNPMPKSIPGRIEAENWDTKSGYEYPVATSDPNGGGQQVVGISNGSWMDYSVNVATTGTYTVSFRIVSTQTSQYQLKSGTTVLGTFNLPNTAGWNNWVTANFTATLTAGIQTLRIISTSTDNPNINWVEFAIAGNQSPTANAGTNQTIVLPATQVSLTGTGTDPEAGVLTYAWTQTGGTAATITSPATAATTITGLTTTGVRTFRLTVTDDHAATATSDVTITVNNPAPPTANAGINQTIILPTAQVSLTGTGTVSNGGSVTYAWTQISGTAATITNALSASTTVTGLTTTGARVFRLTVTQSDNQTATSDVTITVNNPGPPTVNAGISQSVQLPTSQVTLTGSGTSGISGGSIIYAWTRISGPNTSPALTIVSPASATTLVTGLIQGSYVFRLTVTQSDNQTATSDVTVAVNPVITNPGKTIPGRIETEAWDAKSGGMYAIPTTDAGGGSKVVNISNGNYMDYNVTVLNTGNYTVGFRIATTKGNAQFQIKLGTTVLATASIPNTFGWDNWVTYTVSNVPLTAGNQTLRIQSTNNDNCDFNWVEYALAGNQAPTASAGTNQTIVLPATQVSLTGTGTDPEAGVLTYAWTQTGGTAATITSPATAATTITGLTTTGVRTFRLTVTDDHAATATSDVTITVNNPAPPTANAGINQTIILPTAQVSLTGTGTVSNGGAITYAWTQISGTAATITNASSASTTITGLTTTGARVFRLTVTQSDNQTATSDVTITVNNPGPPTVNAGISQSVQLPTSQVTLTGSGTSGISGGSIIYAWTRISGPNTSPALTIVSPASATTSVTGLIQGSYVFRLTVTQSDNQTATSDVTVTVNNAPAPTANAGTNQTITLPVSQVSLTGSGASGISGGSIIYAWTRISGPNSSPALTIVSPATATTSVTGLIQGSYVFRLTVTQSDNQTATSDITITVNPVITNPGKTIPGRIETEAWDAKSGGMYAIPTTDAGGGSKVVNISNGNYMDYNVTVLNTGNYTVGFRIATTKGNAQFQIKLGTTVLATASIPNTFGWDNWVTYTVSNVPLTAGNQTLRIQSTNNENCDFNWMEYSFVSAATGNGTNLFAAAKSSATDNNITTPVIADKQKPVTDQPLALFPNPVYDQFIIKVNNEYTGKMKIQIINGAGRVMKEIQSTKNKGTDQTSLSVNGLQTGTYIIRVQMGEWIKSIKMIKL